MANDSNDVPFRVLILEDVGTARRAFKRYLELKGFQVWEAESPEEADALMRNLTFHVACVDLGMNEEDPSDFRGQEVLKQFADAKEGTRLIVVSKRRGERAHEITIKAYEDYAIARYLKKGQFSPDDYIKAVTNEASKARLGIYRHHETAISALFEGLNDAIWVDRALRALAAKGGPVVVENAIERLVVPVSPLRPLKNTADGALVNSDGAVIRFWSKALGAGVRCVLSRTEFEPDTQELVVRSTQLGGCWGQIVRSPGDARREFAD